LWKKVFAEENFFYFFPEVAQKQIRYSGGVFLAGFSKLHFLCSEKHNEEKQ